MKLQQLRYFQAAYQYNSITAAATALHISQPSISMAIQSLESEFGLKLIERRYQGFTLTPEGHALLEMTNGILHHADQVESRMMNMGKNHVPLRIGVPPMTGIIPMIELYSNFLPNNTSIHITTIEAGSKTLLRRLKEKTLDMSFVSHYENLPPDFISIPISRADTMWCANLDHPFAKEKFIRIEQLIDETIVLFQDSFSLHRLVGRFEDAKIRPNILHQTGQLSMAYALIQRGLASGFLMESVRPFFSNLAWVPLDPPFPSSISLVWERSTQLSKDMKLLVNHCSSKANLY